MMETFSAICTTLVLILISREIEGIRPYSRGRLITVTPAFKDEPGPAFFKLPTSIYDPLLKHYVKVYIDTCYPVELYCFPNDPSYCIFFDYLGNVAGIQIGYIKEYADQVDPKVYNYSSNYNFEEITIFNTTIYGVQIWFTNPEELTEAGRIDVSEIIEGLWAYVDGQLLRFDQRCQTTGPTLGSFDLQGCLPMKGTLYIYNFNRYSQCQNGFFLFLVYDRRSLVGFGHAAPGNFPPGPTRDWFDHPKDEKLARIVPSPPECFNDILPYGFTSSVTFLIDDPYNIKCPICGC